MQEKIRLRSKIDIQLLNCARKWRLDIRNKTKTCAFKLGGVEIEQGYWLDMDKSWPTAQARTDPGNGVARAEM